MLEGPVPGPRVLRHHALRGTSTQAIAEKEVLSATRCTGPSTSSRTRPPSTRPCPTPTSSTGCRENYPDTFDKLLPAAVGAGAAQRPRRATGSSSAACRCSARSARSRWSSPSRATRRRLRASASRTTGARRFQTLLRRLPVDLRAGAGEVRPGVAAGAPDLPGQLRWADPPRRAGLVRPARRATTASTRARRRQTTGTTGTTTPTTPTSDRRPEHHGRQGASVRLRLPVHGPPGALRRRPCSSTLWFQENMLFCAAACFRAPKAMTWGDFWNGLVVPYAEEDPDFDPARPACLDAARRGVRAARRPDPRGDRRRPQGRHRDAVVA